MFWKSAYQLKLASFCSWFLVWLISLFSEAKSSFCFVNINCYFVHLIPIIASDWICSDILVYRKKNPKPNKTAFLFLNNYLLISKLFNVLSISENHRFCLISCHSTLVAIPRTLSAAHPACPEIQAKGNPTFLLLPSLPLAISACLHQGAMLTAPHPWSPIFSLNLRKVQKQWAPPMDILLDSIWFFFPQENLVLFYNRRVTWYFLNFSLVVFLQTMKSHVCGLLVFFFFPQF